MSHGPELVLSWTKELNSQENRHRIQKVEGGDSWVALGCGKGHPWLFLSWDFDCYGCCLARGSEIAPLVHLAMTTPPIVASLKRHLVTSELIDATQVNRDRVLDLRFRRWIGGEASNIYRLILESADRFSNLILADGDGKIIEISHHVHPEANRYRTLLPGLPYTPPPPFSGIDLEKVEDANLLPSARGLGRPLLRKLSLLIEKEAVNTGELLPMLASLYGSDRFVCQRTGSYLTALSEALPEMTAVPGTPLEASRLIVVDALTEKKGRKIVKLLEKVLLEERWRTTQRLQGFQERLRRKETASEERLRGEALYAFAHLVAPRTAEADLPHPEGRDERVHVLLDPDRTAIENGQAYFKRYRKALDHSVGVEAEIERLTTIFNETEEQLAILERADLAALLLLREELAPRTSSKKRKKAVPSHLSFDIDDCRLLVGLTAKGNRYVTFEQASGNDIWFHARNIPGAHVILKCPAEEIPDRAFVAASSLAAHYCRASQDETVTIDYTERKHVRHISGSGPANVTYRDFSSIKVSPRLWRQVLEDSE